METWEREYHVSRIVSGIIQCDQYSIIRPSRESRYLANVAYNQASQLAMFAGVLTGSEALDILIRCELWSSEMDTQLEGHYKAVEDGKVGLFENAHQANARTSIKKVIGLARQEITRLENVRHSIDHYTCEGFASASRVRYLVGSSIVLPPDVTSWDDIVDSIMDHVMRTRIGEPELREIARTEPWRSIWGARTHAGRGLFDLAACDIHDEQRALVLWSSVYDSIREHPECPDETIIEDDDMMDGWMTIQRRKREADMVKKQGELIGNDKIRNADEVFVMASNAEDARKIDKYNDAQAKNTKAQRLSLLSKRKEVNEVEMPDTAQRLGMEAARLAARSIRGH